MPLSALAWGPGHPSLVIADGAELLAYDAETEAPRWRLDVARAVLGVLLADATGLAIGDAGAPFRTPSATAAVLAVDGEGRLYVIDAASGRRLGETGPFGPPRALAASTTGGTIALAAGDVVHVLRRAARAEIAIRASALALSIDGATLVVGTKDGALTIFDVSRVEHGEPPREIAGVAGREAVVDLAPHPDGAWLVAVPTGLVCIDAAGQPRRLDKVRSGPKRIAIDPAGARVALQLTERQVLVYDWPALAVQARIEYTERPVRGLAFGSGDWLGVAMDHGDGNKIDVVTSATHRTDTHAGRTHWSWTLLVEGKKQRLTAQEAEDVRRMKSSSPSSPPFPTGRVGIGAVLALSVIGLRVCARASSSDSHPYVSPGSIPTAQAPCDRACATERIRTLKTECAKAGHACEDGAARALAALEDGDCTKASAALAGMGKVEASGSAFVDVARLFADVGLREACRDGAIQPKRVPHARLVHLAGPDAEPIVEDIPELRDEDGERPRAVWAAPDGTVFVVASVPGSRTEVIHRRSVAGSWAIVHRHTAVDPFAGATLSGRSASDVYATLGGTLVHFDGKAWTVVPAPSAITGVTTSGSDLLVTTAGDDGAAVLRRQGDRWAKESTGDVELAQIRAGGSAVWGLGRKGDADVLVQRETAGRWTVRSAGVDAGASELAGLWVSPGGEPFVLGDGAVLRGTGKGTRWVADELASAGTVEATWGRSSTDVYAATPDRLLHFDGTSWRETSYAGATAALAGTATEVLVVRADE